LIVLLLLVMGGIASAYVFTFVANVINIIDSIATFVHICHDGRFPRERSGVALPIVT